MNEVWKPVVGFESVYEVSDQGRVRRVGGRILKHCPGSNGYCQYTLTSKGKRVITTGHQMVAAAFLGPPPPGYQVNHKNGDKQDTRLENLEYVTSGDNTRHMYEVLGTGNIGSRNGNSRLTDEKVREMKAMRSSQGILLWRNIHDKAASV